jgi:hypothetical protein
MYAEFWIEEIGKGVFLEMEMCCRQIEAVRGREAGE